MDTVVNGTAKAWVNFNGTGTVAIRRAVNVSSITDNGTGDYTVNFTTAMVDADYCVAGTAGSNNTNGNRGTNGIMANNASPPTAGNCRILSAYGASASTDGSLQDVTYCYVAIFS